MKQSNIIFGALIFAFIVYITMRGQLPAYLDLFKPAPKQDPSSSSSGGGGKSLLKSYGKFVLNNAKNMLKAWVAGG